MKSYKLKDGNYIDSTGIVHNKQLLSNILSTLSSIKFADYAESGDLNNEKGKFTVFAYADPINTPPGLAKWGVGVCVGNSLYRAQILIGNYSYSSDYGANKRMAIRNSIDRGNTWTEWQYF